MVKTVKLSKLREDLSFFSLFVYALMVSVSAIFRLYLGTNELFAILTVSVCLFLGTNELFLRCVYVCFWELMSYSYTDTINAYTNNEKKLKSSVGSRSFCSTCDTGDVTLVRNLVIRS
jgi:hypothetical protein